MRVGIIGMGVIGGGLAALFAQEHHLFLFDRNRSKVDKAAEVTGGRACDNVQELAAQCDVVVVAVQPGRMELLAKELSKHVTKDQIVISVAAGYTVADLRKLYAKPILVRCMPNTAMSCGMGVMALEQDDALDDAAKEKIDLLFAPAGFVAWLPSEKIEMVGALAGSGIAFVLSLIEAMSEAGIAMGLSATESQQLAAHTFAGAAVMAGGRHHPAQLKWEVAVPGGTTIEGLRTLEREGARAALTDAVLATYNRAKEIH